jgi:hypothetical protein
MTLSISDTQHNNALLHAECRYADCHVLFIVMYCVIMLNVSMLSVAMLSVLAPFHPSLIFEDEATLRVKPSKPYL